MEIDLEKSDEIDTFLWYISYNWIIERGIVSTR